MVLYILVHPTTRNKSGRSHMNRVLLDNNEQHYVSGSIESRYISTFIGACIKCPYPLDNVILRSLMTFILKKHLDPQWTIIYVEHTTLPLKG